MILRMGCKLALGAASAAVLGAFVAGAALGAALGVGIASGRVHPPGARWPAEAAGDAAEDDKPAPPQTAP